MPGRPVRTPAALGCALLSGLTLIVVCALQGRAATEPVAGLPEPDPAPALKAVADMRGRIDAQVLPENLWQALTYRNRAALEIKGRDTGPDGRQRTRDFAVFDLGSARLVLYINFANASTRVAGEPIISLSEISTRADQHLSRILPGNSLALHDIQRYRASGQESLYYEARYTTVEGGVTFLQPPVRLLIDASSGKLFRLDIEPEWPESLPVPQAQISRKAAERIATVSLQARDLTAVFGPGAFFETVTGAELFYVQQNDWLGFREADPAGRARVAWVVPFRIKGAAVGDGDPAIFVDAATGRVLGGQAGR